MPEDSEVNAAKKIKWTTHQLVNSINTLRGFCMTVSIIHLAFVLLAYCYSKGFEHVLFNAFPKASFIGI